MGSIALRVGAQIAAIAAMLLPAAFALAANPTARAFTVRDSIELTTIADPNLIYARLAGQELKWAPDRRHFFIVVRRGDVASNVNVYTLLLYDVADIRASLEQGRYARPHALARIASSSNLPGIGRARWLADGRAIAFLGAEGDQTAQIYVVDLAGGAARRLSAHETGVVDFDVDLAAGQIVYSAVNPRDWSERNAHGYVVGAESIVDNVGRGHHSLRIPIAFYQANTDGSTPRRLDIAPYDLVSQDFPWGGIWLSPDARWAVAVRHVPLDAVTWANDYLPIAGNSYYQAATDPSVRSFSRPPPWLFLQYVLINLETSKVEPLLDAPVAGASGLNAHWLRDSSAVVVTNTFLPLDRVRSQERKLRRATPSVVEVDVRTRVVRRIVDVIKPGSNDRDLTGSELDRAGRLTVFWRGGGARTFARRSNGWSAAKLDPTNDELTVRIVQGPNQPPELRAEDVKSGKSAVVTDFNPQLSGLAVGDVETIRWTDSGGREWIGGLLRPVGYTHGRRYPLVIQTHGYDPDEFLVDGPAGSTAGYAARALANRGIVVVQVKDIVGPIGARPELDNQIAGYRSLIDKLTDDGLIDRSLVGLHGWSRTGYYVQQALLFSDLNIAVASVSDASQLSAYKYVNFYGLEYPGMIEDERMIGVPLWGEENRATWVARDPMFNLHRLCAPLRIEVYENGFGWWDVFAILRRQRRPVEYLSFPRAAHAPVRPWERMTSQEGTVDWYDFWLNRREDPDPAKSEQYRRWRELRKQHNSLRQSGQSCPDRSAG